MSSQSPFKTVLRLILDYVDQIQKVGSNKSCALVSRDWEAAAAAATTRIVLDKCADTDSLQRYLRHHGKHLQVLHVRCTPGIFAQLPTPNLQELLLNRCFLHVGQASSLLQDLPAASELTRLVLSHVGVFGVAGSPSILAALAACTALRHLQLQHLFEPRELGTEQPLTAPAALLQQQHLPHLSYLSLGGELQSAQDVLQGLSTLTTLQDLELQGWCWVTDALLKAIQHLQHLTSLRLLETDRDVWCGAARFAQLTALQQLVLGYEEGPGGAFGCLNPAILSDLPQLHHLELHNIGFHYPESAPALLLLDADGDDPVLPDPELVQQLLSVLAGMQQLTQLSLQRVDSLAGAPVLQAYSALTASSALQHLDLSPACLGAGHEPPLWPLVFPPERQLQQLTALSLSHATPRLTSNDLDRVVQCCPALKDLDLVESLTTQQQGESQVDLAALTRLRSLTLLALSGVIDDHTSVGILVQLTGEGRAPLSDPRTFGAT